MSNDETDDKPVNPYEPTPILPMTVVESLKALRKQIRRNKIWNWMLTIVAVVLVAVCGTMVVLYLNQASQSAQQKQSLIQGCHNSNEARTANRVVFDALIDLSVATNNAVLKDPYFVAWEHKVNAMPPGADRDQAEALLALEKEIVTPKSNAIQQAENFKNYIAKSYPPIDCSKISGGKS